MADPECEKACGAAYQDSVKNCVKVLEECLATAKTPAQEDECKTRFRKCMALAKKARDICREACS